LNVKLNSIMSQAKNSLTPEALSMLRVVEQCGSFAAAARELGLVPSALSYRIRQMEQSLDVLLFDRNSRRAVLTAAGDELLKEGQRILGDLDSLANRVRRIATGWESEFTIAVDSIIDQLTFMELCESFLAMSPPTKLKFVQETLNGTLEALTLGRADLALGVTAYRGTDPHIQIDHLGQVEFVFAVAPHHPLAKMQAPLSDELIKEHRAVAIADSARAAPANSFNLLSGQDVFTVPSLQSKIEAQIRGFGAGFLPRPAVSSYLTTGRLVACKVERNLKAAQFDYAWRVQPVLGKSRKALAGRAMQWWLSQLKNEVTRSALLCHPLRQ
jgi:DNA-binding transcriptional LysR family regulator